MNDDKERLLKLILDLGRLNVSDEDPGVDYAEEYKKQTGKNLEANEYVN